MIYLNKILYYSLLLFPALLITGPFLPDLVLVICCLIFLFIIFYTKNFFYFKNFFFVYFLIFYLVIIISSIFSDYQSLSIKTSILYIRFGVFILVIQYVIENNINFFKNLNLILSLIIFILFIDASIQIYFEVNILGMELQKPNNFIRASSFFGDELKMGSYVSRIFPLILISYFLNKQYKKNNIYLISTVFISSVLILYSGERTALVMFLITIVGIVIFSNYSIKKKIFFFLIFFTISGFLIFIVKPDFIKRLVYVSIAQYESSIKNLDSSNQDEFFKIYFSEQHKAHANTALKMFFDKPIIGQGPKTFRFLCDDKRYKVEKFILNTADQKKFVKGCSTHPHNLYIQLLSETGILGFILVFNIFLYIFYIILKILIKKIFIKKFLVKNIIIICLFGIIIHLFPMLPSGNFFNNWLSCIMYYTIFICFYLLKKNKDYGKNIFN